MSIHVQYLSADPLARQDSEEGVMYGTTSRKPTPPILNAPSKESSEERPVRKKKPYKYTEKMPNYDLQWQLAHQQMLPNRAQGKKSLQR